MAVLTGVLWCVLLSEIAVSLVVSTIQVVQDYNDLPVDDHKVNVNGGQRRIREVQDRDDKIYWKDNGETQKYEKGAVVTKVLYHGIYPSLNVTEEIGKPRYWAQSDSSRVKRNDNYTKTDSWSSFSSDSQRYAPPGSGFSLVHNGQSFSAGQSTFTQTVSSSSSTWINGRLVPTSTIRPLTTTNPARLSTGKWKSTTPSTTRKPERRWKRQSGNNPSNKSNGTRNDPLSYGRYYNWLLDRENKSKHEFELNNEWPQVNIGKYYQVNDSTNNLRSYHNPSRFQSSFIGSTETNGIVQVERRRIVRSRSFSGASDIPRQSSKKHHEQIRQSIINPNTRYRRFAGLASAGPSSNAQQTVPVRQVISESADQTHYLRAEHPPSPGFYTSQQRHKYDSSKPPSVKYRTLYIPETNQTNYKGDPHNKGRVKLVSVAYYSTNRSNNALRDFQNTLGGSSGGLRQKRDTWCVWLNDIFKKIGLYKTDSLSDTPQSEPLVMNSEVNEVDQNLYGFSSNGNGHRESEVDIFSEVLDFGSDEPDADENELQTESSEFTVSPPVSIPSAGTTVPSTGTVIIQAPPKKITCKPPKRQARGRCRTVW